jgi:hypothetical protein
MRGDKVSSFVCESLILLCIDLYYRPHIGEVKIYIGLEEATFWVSEIIST